MTDKYQYLVNSALPDWVYIELYQIAYKTMLPMMISNGLRNTMVNLNPVEGKGTAYPSGAPEFTSDC